MVDYNKFYLGRLLNALSQLGNAISGGNPDISISARVGHKQKSNLYWLVANTIIDFTFYPVDGKDHCYLAYLAEKGENFKSDLHIGKGNVIGFVIMALLFIVVCSVLIPILWSYHLFKNVFFILLLVGFISCTDDLPKVDCSAVANQMLDEIDRASRAGNSNAIRAIEVKYKNRYPECF